jgi:hypothetical protein
MKGTILIFSFKFIVIFTVITLGLDFYMRLNLPSYDGCYLEYTKMGMVSIISIFGGRESVNNSNNVRGKSNN